MILTSDTPVLGFAYDRTTFDFKIVVIVYTLQMEPQNGYHARFWVYDENSWSEQARVVLPYLIKDPTYTLSSASFSIQEVVFWLGNKGGDCQDQGFNIQLLWEEGLKACFSYCVFTVFLLISE